MVTLQSLFLEFASQLPNNVWCRETQIMSLSGIIDDVVVVVVVGDGCDGCCDWLMGLFLRENIHTKTAFFLSEKCECVCVGTDRVEQHGADVLPVAVLQAGPTELTFGPDADPAATNGLSVQSLLSALVARAALRETSTNTVKEPPKPRTTTTSGWGGCGRSRSPCPRSCLCCGTRCSPGHLR